MSRFNQVSSGIKTTNLAGGKAYKQSKELELISILLNSFAKDEYYRTSGDTFKQLKELIELNDKKFVAKAAIYARTKFGMRSITHVAAAELAKHISGESWAKEFYNAIIYRPDDMMEILSYLFAGDNKIPNSIKKGFAKAFDKFDAYKLAKYKNEGKKIKLVDVVNLVHPKPSNGNTKALEQLMKGELKSFDTWENELSNVGQITKDEKEKAKLKSQVWTKLINEKKIGQFALLRNLRNILEQAPEAVSEACNLLIEPERILNSLILPFRFSTAYEQILNLDNRYSKNVLIAISKALDTSMQNVPKFDGETLVVCDYSGSMGDGITSMRGKATLFGIALAKRSNSDFMIFGIHSEYINYNPLDATISLIERMNKLNSGYGYGYGYGYGHNVRHFEEGVGNVGHGTNFHSIFETANKKYDRIVVFSDEQGWIGHNTPVAAFNKYKVKYNANPKLYMFDLAAYGTMQFPEKDVYCLSGFSDKIFQIMKMMEEDKNALINTINNVNF